MIPYSRQRISSSDIDSVAQALRGDLLTTGPRVDELESLLAATCGARHAIVCSNGTTALHLACLALEIGAGDLGITSPITFLASANCIEYCRGRVDFVDIDERLCLSPQELERYCKEKEIPKVVIAVSFAGVTPDLPAIWGLAAKYGFKVIEDAAHSLGTRYRDVTGSWHESASCAHSDAAILSFHPVKTITTGEGGAVLTNNDALAARLKAFRSHGMIKDPSKLSRNDGPWYYEMQDLGYNYRLTDIQCALGISQLRCLAEFRAAKLAIAEQYDRAFLGLPGTVTPPRPADVNPCLHLYPLRFSEGPGRRASMYQHLASLGIGTQVHYIPVYFQPYYRNRYGFEPGKCPAAERYYDSCLSLPLYPDLEDVESVIDGVRSGLGVPIV